MYLLSEEKENTQAKRHLYLHVASSTIYRRNENVHG